MEAFCTNCGSRNHPAFDCLKSKRSEPLPLPDDMRQPEPALVAVQEVGPEPDMPPLLPPRWLGGPDICSAEGLPAFKDAKEADAFYTKLGTSWSSRRLQWDCPKCGRIHRDCVINHSTSGDRPVRKSGPPFKADPDKEADQQIPAALRRTGWEPFRSEASLAAMAKRNCEAMPHNLPQQVSRTEQFNTDPKPTGAPEKKPQPPKELDLPRAPKVKQGGPQGALF